MGNRSDIFGAAVVSKLAIDRLSTQLRRIITRPKLRNQQSACAFSWKGRTAS